MQPSISCLATLNIFWSQVIACMHSMANIHMVGRMETALAAGLYFTVKDYSNPAWPTRWSCDRKSQGGEAAQRFCHCSQLSGRQDDASRLPIY